MFCRTLPLPLYFVSYTPRTPPSSPALTLFENVRIFDGKSEALSASMNVLVRGNIIEKISKDPIPIDGNSSAKIIAGGGRTLMPGLIDVHWHAMLVRPTATEALAWGTSATPTWWPAWKRRMRCCVGSPRCATWADPSSG